MSRLSEGVERSYQFIASKQLAAGLWLLLCVILVPRTLAESPEISLGTVPNIIIGLIGLNLTACTIRKLKALSVPVLIMHFGTVLVVAGGVISSFGFVATVNVYEGETVNAAYRWDLKKDMPLGVDLTVKKINVQYYPVPVKVGVLMGEEKVGLFELKTGESFQIGQYTVKADSLEFPTEQLSLKVFQRDKAIGSADTAGGKDLPAGFPYDFRLVANKKPNLKMTGVELEISKDSRVLTGGTSEANSPLTWESLSFYNTEVNADEHGLRFAGIQITKDPGRPFVYFGFAVMGIGSAMYFARRVRGHR